MPPSQAETTEMRDARLERLALERDKAVELLRRWDIGLTPIAGREKWLYDIWLNTRKFLESLT